MLAGSVLGGALIGLVGIDGLTLLDATTYLLSAVAIALIAVPALAPGAEATAPESIGLPPLRRRRPPPAPPSSASGRSWSTGCGWCAATAR